MVSKSQAAARTAGSEQETQEITSTVVVAVDVEDEE
ncbi:hypothetical protein JOF59_006063 [Streptomyces clavifer]|uniref:Uncharacterized protein n=1 Tax=Streptomyces clavifer TaxID=68188 RepID=A0ABS4VI37_9ACTN|nr:hypothetical protein [Streptomyces clavifer]